MMTLACKAVRAYLESQEVRYEVIEDDNFLRVGFRLNNMDGLSIFMLFSEENENTVEFKAYQYVRYPDTKVDAMYKLCNDMNKRYRYIKFMVEEEERYVVLTCDLNIQLDTCGEVVFDQLMTMFQIADYAYPDFMRELFSR